MKLSGKLRIHLKKLKSKSNNGSQKNGTICFFGRRVKEAILCIQFSKLSICSEMHLSERTSIAVNQTMVHVFPRHSGH